MAEILEYALVVMVSTAFLAGSIMTYNSFAALESGLQFRSTFSTISALADRAVTNGSSSASLSILPSNISCRGGVLTVSSGSRVDTRRLPVNCDFIVQVPEGTHRVSFSVRFSNLSFSVA